MWTTRLVSTVAVGGVALTLGLAGCGSDSESTEETTTETTAATITDEIADGSPQAPKPDQLRDEGTIKSYIEQNGITNTPVGPGEPGAPTVELSAPEGWVNGTPEMTPPDAFATFIYTGPDAGTPPPRMIVWLQKLTGDVDPEKVLKLAGNDLTELSDWQALNAGLTTELSGYQAFQLAGTYVLDGVRRLVAQKTVVIPADDAVYVLQFNMAGRPEQVAIIGPATTAIDEQTKITLAN